MEHSGMVQRPAGSHHRSGEVLDAGCGHAELALALSERGYAVTGLDVSPSDVTASAAERGLRSAVSAHGDVSDFDGHDARFATIMDSGLFRMLTPTRREGYPRCVARAGTANTILFIVALAAPDTGPGEGPGPRGVTEDGFRQMVSRQCLGRR